MNKTAVALGFFDGVHKGHQTIIKRAVSEAEARGLEPLAVTFENQPRAFLTGQSQSLLTTPSQRRRYLTELGIKRVIMLPFNAETASMPPEDFCRMLKDEYGAGCAVCGQNYTFGDKGMGNCGTLEEMGKVFGFESIVCPHLLHNGRVVSSTWIRELVAKGGIDTASELLGRYYEIEGRVTHGRQEGRKMGFPTCNMELDPVLMEPRHGVYAAYADIEGKSFKCALNIGTRPTFGLEKTVAEFYILDYEGGELYGKDVRLRLKGFIRNEADFGGSVELSRRIEKDVGLIKELLK